MTVIANRSFTLHGEDYIAGQELDIEDSRLASRLVRTRWVVEPDRTNVETRLVVTHRPAKDCREEVEVRDENGNRVVACIVVDGPYGKTTPRLDANGEKVVKYRTVTHTTTKRGFEWFGEWLSPGDTFPDDGRLTPMKRRHLTEVGWIKEVPANKPNPKGRPKGSKNRKSKRRSNANTRAA